MGPTQTLSTRDSILDAAGRLIGRLGYHKTTMEDLAREAGVARRTLYLHFESKDDILLARIDRVVERLLQELGTIAAEKLTAPQRLERLLVRRVTFRLEVVQDYYHSLDEIFQNLRKPYLERRERYFAREAALLALVIDEGRKRGELSCEDSATTARSLIVATNALLPFALSVREMGSRREIEREAQRVAELLLNGLKKRTR